MPTTIKLKNSVTTTNAPSSLVQGEVAINITDKKVWVGNAATTPIQLLGDGGSASFTSLSLSGNLTFTGTGNRITGDFSNSTQTNRVIFQTSITNGNTTIGAIPNGTATTAVFRAFNNSDPTNSSELSLFATSADMRVMSNITGTGTYLPLTMYTGGSERLRIDTSGNVGIGTASPVEKLTVSGSISLNTDLVLKEGTTARGYIFGTSAGLNYRATSGLPHIFQNVGTELMRIDSSGNVSIGTSTAFSKFGVSTTNGNLGITGGNTSGGNKIQSFGATTTSNGYLAFEGYSAEYMRIDSSGNVGIGTSSPGAYSNQTTLAINGTTYGRVDLMNGGTVRGYLYGGSGGVTLETAGSLPVSFATAGTERMRINAGAAILCLSGGNTSATGTGIAFPATQSASSDANTLDDYEEGTFTPTLFGATTAGTTTYSTQLGVYTKIGRQVTVSLNVTATATTGTGELRIGGLPFAASGTYLYLTAPYVTGLNWGGGTYLMILSRPNETNLEMQYMSDDGNAGNQQLTNETQGILLTLTYFT